MAGLVPGHPRLATIVTGEDHDRVAVEAIVLDRPKHAADLLVQRQHHALVGLARAAVKIAQIVSAEALGLSLIVRTFPGPMWRAEMQAEQNRLARPGIVRD